MNSGKSIALLIIALAIIGMYAHSKHVLKPIFNVSTHMPNSTDLTETSTQIGKFVAALFFYFIALSFLDQRQGFYLTLTIVLGALTFDQVRAEEEHYPNVFSAIFD